MAEPESLIDTVEQERDKYDDTLTNPQMGELLNNVAWRHRDAGWVLAGKDTGAHTRQPHTGTPISRDVLIHVPSARMYDVLADVAGEARPQWLYVGPVDYPVVHPTGADEPEEPEPEAVRYHLETALRYLGELKDTAIDTEAELHKALEKL